MTIIMPPSYIHSTAKSLYRVITHEIFLGYHFTKYNIDAGILPFPIFTAASLLHRGAHYSETMTAMACMKKYNLK